MRGIQIAGIIISLLVIVYGVNKYRNRRYSKLDLLISLLVAAGLLTVSINPAVGDYPARLLGMQTRWFSVLFISNIVTFGLFLYVLNKANHASRSIGKLVRALAASEYRQNYTTDATQRSIFVVIPAYNEADAIAGVLQQMPTTLYGHSVCPIVVVDGATDETAEVVRRENYMVASHLVNRGQGDALRTGFEIALNEGADIVMTMDADGQHRVEDMGPLVRPLVNNAADYVMGSRFLGEYEERGGARHLGIVGFTYMINLLGNVKITDCTNGFRAIRATELDKLELREDRFNAPELIMEAAKKDLRIMEVPVTIASRSAGESKKPPNFRYPLGFFRTIVQVWLR